MKWFFYLSMGVMLMACRPTISDGLADGSVFRRFKQPQSYELRSGLPVDASVLEPFRDGDIIYTVSFGQKLDKTGILYIVPISEEPNQSVYISKVTLVTPTFTLEKDINAEFSLIERPTGHYGFAIRIVEDIDFTKIPMDTKSISIELDYKVDECKSR